MRLSNHSHLLVSSRLEICMLIESNNKYIYHNLKDVFCLGPSQIVYKHVNDIDSDRRNVRIAKCQIGLYMLSP